MVTTETRRIFIEHIAESAPGDVRLRGWIYRLRVLGKTAFVILRDCTGEAQCVIATEGLKDLHLKVEDVVEIRGKRAGGAALENRFRSRHRYDHGIESSRAESSVSIGLRCGGS